MTLRRFFFQASFLLLSAARSLAADPAVSYVPARDYPAVVEREIDAAKSSIHLYLYLFTYRAAQSRSLPARLAQALIRARKRGVRVDVVLDPGDAVWQDGAAAAQNNEAAQLLRQNDVDVSFSSGPVLHAKALVVDDNTVLAGSTNWTMTAFTDNAEVNLLARSPETAKAVLKELQSVPRRPPPAPVASFPVPESFLSPDVLGPMVTREDLHGVTAYLYILRQAARGVDASTAPFPLDGEALAQILDLPHKSRGVDRQLTRSILNRLQDRYHLIEFFPGGMGGDFLVRPAPSSGPVVSVPDDYARYGWDRRLSLAAKAFILLSLHYAPLSPVSPRWSISERTLAQAHGFKRRVIQHGVLELRRAALLEVEYAPLAPDTNVHVRPTIYTPQPFYDPAPLQARLQALEKTHSPQTVARAKGFAALLFDDSDVNAIEQFISLEEQYGPAPLDKAAAILGAKDPANPKRTTGYFINTVKNIAQGK